MDYYSIRAFDTPEHNDIGGESNLERLEGRELSGSRLSYSSKSSSSSETEQSSDHTSETTSSTTNTTDLATKTTGTGVTPTSVATTSAVGGVVVASVIIFTSLLGNQFKLVDNSLTLSTYRNIETNEISLDYSFDLQYDMSGEVYVKLLSVGHSLVSEPYEIIYEYEEEPIDPNQGDGQSEGGEGEVIEKEKPIFTINIDGTFDGLVEKNEYNFVITSMIDGTEAQIYTSRLYIPSSYVNVLEDSVELYKDKETQNYGLDYAFFVSYETEAELYVELRRLNEEGNYVVEQVSDTYLLKTYEEQADGDQYYNEISGYFENLTEYGDYIVNLVSTCNGFVNTAYTQRFIAHIDKEIISYVVDDDNFSYEVYYEDALYIRMGVILNEYHGGYLYFELINNKTGQITYSDTCDVIYEEEEMAVGTSVAVSDLTTDYTCKVHSVVDGEDVVVYEKLIETSVPYGYPEGFAISNVNYGNGNVYEVSYALITDLDAETYFKVVNPSTEQVIYTSQTYDRRSADGIFVRENVTGIQDQVTYQVDIYANRGNQDVLVDYYELEGDNYGISVNTQGIVSDYEEYSITIPIQINDRHSYLDNFYAYLSDPEQQAGTAGNEQVIEFNDETTELNFYLEDVTKGTALRLKIEATDSNNNDTSTVFVDMAIWY